MRKFFLYFSVLILLFSVTASLAQNVKVTFLVNTASVPDTLKPVSTVQIRGSEAPLTWDGKTGVTLQNIGGDYWKGSGTFATGKTVQFKIYTNAVDATGGREHQGWEQDLNDPTNNRILIVGTKDTTLPLQFANGSPTKQNQYWTPYTPSDSIDMWFRVNMQGKEDFNAASQVMGLRGSNNKDWGATGDLEWGKSTLLTQETQHGNGGSRQYDGTHFWSGKIRVPKGTWTPGQELEFKFVIMKKGDPTSADPLRWADVQMKTKLPIDNEDTTVYWHWWNDAQPAAFKGNDTVTVTYIVDMTKAMQMRGFRLGDSVFVRTGWAGTARTTANVSPTNSLLLRQGLSSKYSATEKLVLQKNKPTYYQYYITRLGEDIRETFYNFDYQGTDNALAERRSFDATVDSFAIQDVTTSVTDMRRQPVFRNTTKLARTVTVTYICDLRPAICTVARGDTIYDIQGSFHVTQKDSILKWGVWINGPAAGGWNNDGGDWGYGLMNNLSKKMWDDGTHGDAKKDDSLFTVQFTYGPDSSGSKKFIGQEFKFGIRAGDNENGQDNQGYGNNHVENIDDSQPTCTIASQFGSINPKYYNCWDFTKGTLSDVENMHVPPVVYKLDQNYPNPFSAGSFGNPSTSIGFEVPKKSDVTIKVFDTMGRMVKFLVDGPYETGSYVVQFDASEFANGFYFYHMQAGSYSEVKKMVLVK